MSVNVNENRRRRTSMVARKDREGRILVPNGHKGRSQKGCFGNGSKFIREE